MATRRKKKLTKIITKRFTQVLQNEPVFVENGIKGLFGLVLAFGWVSLSPQVSGQILLVGSFLLGLYTRMTVTPVAKARTGGEKQATASMARTPDPAAVGTPAPEAVSAT
jgi:hypothetical protein